MVELHMDSSLEACFARFLQTAFFWWRSRLPRCVNIFPQRSQLKGLDPRCVRMWSLTLHSLLNFFEHIEHCSSWFIRPVSSLRHKTFLNPLPFVILDFAVLLRSILALLGWTRLPGSARQAPSSFLNVLLRVQHISLELSSSALSHF